MTGKLPASDINFIPWPAQRYADGAHEFVSYPPGSSFRVWYSARANRYDPHWHADTEIIMVTGGECHVTAQGRKYVLSEGDVILIPAGIMHALTSMPRGARYVFMFEINNSVGALKCLSPLLSMMVSPLLIARDNAVNAEARALLRGIVREYSAVGPFRELKNYASILSLYALFGGQQLITVYESGGSGIRDRAYNDLYAHILDFIGEHFAEPLTLDAVAAEAGFSRCHFTRFFKKCAGVTFHEYLTAKRLAVAEELMRLSNLSITDIALQAGFTSVPTFNRVYKKERNRTPSEYRLLNARDRAGAPSVRRVNLENND